MHEGWMKVACSVNNYAECIQTIGRVSNLSSPDMIPIIGGYCSKHKTILHKTNYMDLQMSKKVTAPKNLERITRLRTEWWS